MWCYYNPGKIDTSDMYVLLYVTCISMFYFMIINA